MTEDTGGVQLVTLYTRTLMELAKNPKVSQETLARRLDVTMRTAQRHLTELENEGFVSVDRSRKPFRYSIDWTKSFPHVPWLHVVIFHPEVQSALQRLSDVATSCYEKAQQDGSDPAEALHNLFAEQEAQAV